MKTKDGIIGSLIIACIFLTMTIWQNKESHLA